MTELLSLQEREQLAEGIRARIVRGDDVIRVLYEPGDSTHYELVLARLGAHPAIGACPVDWRELLHPRELADDRWLLAWPGFGCMTVSLDLAHWTDPTYVAEKMGRTGRLQEGSAVLIAELLNMVTHASIDWLRAMREQHTWLFGDDQ